MKKTNLIEKAYNFWKEKIESTGGNLNQEFKEEFFRHLKNSNDEVVTLGVKFSPTSPFSGIIMNTSYRGPLPQHTYLKIDFLNNTITEEK